MGLGIADNSVIMIMGLHNNEWVLSSVHEKVQGSK